MHDFAAYVGVENFLQPVNSDDLQYVQRYAVEPQPPASYEFLMAAKILMHENGLQMPTRVEEALDFFITLKYIMKLIIVDTHSTCLFDVPFFV